MTSIKFANEMTPIKLANDILMYANLYTTY